jgi:hypothetical protein
MRLSITKIQFQFVVLTATSTNNNMNIYTRQLVETDLKTVLAFAVVCVFRNIACDTVLFYHLLNGVDTSYIT